MTITESTALELLAAIKQNIKLMQVSQKPDKAVWVKAFDLKDHTIWQDGQDYRKARENDWVRYRLSNGGIEYDITSIPEQFKKK